MPNDNWTKRRRTSDNPSATVHNLLRVLGIPSTYGRVARTLQEHPDYPSVLSMAESLPEWGVKTEGVKGEVGDLTEVDYPSIVHLRGAQGRPMDQDFAVLEDMTGGRVRILQAADGRQTLSLDEFAEIWSGVLLRAFPGERTGEPDYEAHRKTQRLNRSRKYLTLIGLPVLFLLAFSCGLAQVGSLGTLIPLGLAKAVGFAMCMVMVAAALGQGGLMSSLCPMGKVMNCARVMRSPASKLFGVSMAEWGMLYFGGGLLSLLAAFFLGQFQNDLFMLGLIGLLALPYTLFSIIYQAFVVRSWCWMCLAIVGLFWLEFYLLYHIIVPAFGAMIIGLTFPLSLLLGFGVASVGWTSLKHVIKAAKKADRLERQATRLRRQPEYIQFQLSKAEKIDLGKPPFEVEIGPRDAGLTITAVVNPLCRHCWRVFNQLDQLIGIAGGNLKGAVRFLVTPNKEEETPTETERFIDRAVSLRILTIARNGNPAHVHEALADWFKADGSFSKAKYRRWQQKYGSEDSEPQEEAAEVLNFHLSWAMHNKIVVTPTLFFNGIRLPGGLQLDDLKIFLLRQFQS